MVLNTNFEYSIEEQAIPIKNLIQKYRKGRDRIFITGTTPGCTLITRTSDAWGIEFSS